MLGFLGVFGEIDVTARADEQHCAALRMERIDHFSKLHSISYGISIDD